MRKPKHHILVCSSSKFNGEPKGMCRNKNAVDLIQYLENELMDRGMDEVLVTNTGCLKLCDRGPVMIVYPEAFWYGNINESAIDEILDALEEGEAAEQYLLS